MEGSIRFGNSGERFFYIVMIEVTLYLTRIPYNYYAKYYIKLNSNGKGGSP